MHSEFWCALFFCLFVLFQLLERGGGLRRRRTGRSEAKRRREWAARASVRLSGCGARGGGLRARAGKAGGVRGRRAARSAAARLRFDGSGADSGGEKVREHEQAAGKLTGDRFGAKDGRRKEFVERGGAPVSGNDGRWPGGSIRAE